MKVMLIDPPGFRGNAIGRILGSFGSNKADQAWPPYDLQIIAGCCRKYGHGFRILDANNLGLSGEDIRRHIESFQPDWVVYLTCFQTLFLDAQVAYEAKLVNPGIKTACVSLSIYSVEEPEDKLRDLEYLDYIIWGEPELPLMRLINGDEPSEVAGLYYKDSSGKVCFTGPAPKAENLDEFGMPAHYGLPIKIYKCPVSIRHPMTIVNCSRGCVNWCIHCQAGAFQQPMRYRSLANVLDELREIQAIGIREIKFYDCSLPSDPEFCTGLCEAMISEKFDFSWNCNSRAEMIHPDIVKLMKRAGKGLDIKGLLYKAITPSAKNFCCL